MEPSLKERLEAERDRLSPAALRVAEFLATRPDRAAVASAVEIAAAASTSDATVVRTVHLLGYSGLPELRRSVGAEWAARTNPRDVLEERVARVGAERHSLLDALVDDAIEILKETRRRSDHASVAAATAALVRAERVTVLGIGRAGSLAEYLALGLARIGRRASAATHSGFRLADDLASIRSGDVLVVIAPLRHLHEVDVALARAEEMGAPVVLVTETLGEKLRGRVDHVLATGSSHHRLANEAVAPLIVLDSLLLGVAAADPKASLSSWTVINQLRTDLMGPALDVPPSLLADGSPD